MCNADLSALSPQEIQDAYDERIRSRDPKQIIDLFAVTKVPPSKENLDLVLRIGDRIQEVMDIRSNGNGGAETRYRNIYAIFSGLGGSSTPEDLVRQYAD